MEDASTKKAISLWLSLLLILTIIISSDGSSNNISAGFPMPRVSDATYINSDWIVNDAQVRENETIVLSGNLTVESGGNLIFNNVTLLMNCTATEQWRIDVRDGGVFRVLDLDADNITTGDASILSANNSAYNFLFIVRQQATFEMRNSELHECGGGYIAWPWIPAAPNLAWYGMCIMNNSVIVDRCYISNNRYGIVLYDSDAIISNNTIDWNYCGIMSGYWSNSTIVDNIFNWNEIYGIWVNGGSSPPNDKDSNPYIARNKIFNTGRSIYTAVPIQINDGSCPRIINNIIINYTEDAIYCGEQCQAIIENNYIDSQGGNFGIVGSSSRNVYVRNCTIIDNTVKEQFWAGTMWFHVINCTFNRSKVWLEGSSIPPSIEVGWYLDVKVQDQFGNPVPGANVRITDNVNGSYDEIFSTDMDGRARSIELVEYNTTQNGTTYYTSHQIIVSKHGYFSQIENISMNESKSLIIILAGDENPLANAGLDQSVEEEEAVSFDGSGSTDDVGVVWYNWSFGDCIYNNGTNINPSHTYPHSGMYIVTLNVTDTIGQSDTDACLIFVNNIAPIANAGGDKSGNEGQAITFDGGLSTDTASDILTLTYIWYFGDGNSSIGKAVSHCYQDNGLYNATLVVTDDNGYVDSDMVAVTVGNVAPMIEYVPGQTAQQGILFTLKINVTDVPADILTFSDNSTLFDINPVTGIIQFTPTNNDVGLHFVKIAVSDDDTGNSSISFNITILNTNDPPAIQSVPPQTATQNVPFSLQVMATDPDAGDTLAYSLTAQPAGMSIGTTTGQISWIPTNTAVGSHAVTIRVDDAMGLYDEKTFTITVANVNDIPTIATFSLPDATEDTLYFYGIQADDIDIGDNLSFSLDSAPPWLFIEAGTGLLFGTPTNVHVGTRQIIVNVTDGTAYATRILNLTVLNVNDLPVITSYPNTIAEPGVEYFYNIVAMDDDAGDVLTYSLAEAPEGMTIDSQTGRISWTPTNTQAEQTYRVVIQASDGHDSTAQTFSIFVDTVPAEPYHPLFDNYIWLGIIIFLIAIIILMLLRLIKNPIRADERIDK